MIGIFFWQLLKLNQQTQIQADDSLTIINFFMLNAFR